MLGCKGLKKKLLSVIDISQLSVIRNQEFISNNMVQKTFLLATKFLSFGPHSDAPLLAL